MRQIQMFAFLGVRMSVILTAASAAAALDVESATRSYLDMLQGPARERSDRYFEGGYWLLLWDAVAFIAACWLLLRSGLSARLRSSAERIVPSWLVPAFYSLMFVPILSIILLPWNLYTGWYRERQYELSNLSLADWLAETAIATIVLAIAAAIVFLLLFALIKRFPKRWWLGGGAALSVFFAFSILVAPIVIAPLFNEFRPMASSELRDEILAMAQQHQVPADDVYVVDESRQHKRISAFVAGLGPTVRIALNDNLLNRTSPAEVKAVMGHELGHYVLGHMPIIWGVTSAIAFLVLYLIFRLSPFLLSASASRWRVRDPSDVAVVPVYIAIAAGVLLLLTPATSTFARTIESDADEFGLDAAREPDAFARVALRLSEYRKLEPSPLEQLVFYDHPSGEARIRRAMEWKARELQ